MNNNKKSVPHSKNFSSIAALLPKVLKNKKIHVESDPLDVFKIWPQIIGEEFKDTTKPIGLNKGLLLIEVIDAAVIQELSMQQNSIQKNLINLGFGGKVSKLKFISSSPKNFKR